MLANFVLSCTDPLFTSLEPQVVTCWNQIVSIIGEFLPSDIDQIGFGMTNTTHYDPNTISYTRIDVYAPALASDGYYSISIYTPGNRFIVGTVYFQSAFWNGWVVA